ncbi:MAG: response regulator transcription factor [Acetobacteraceae bacterium]|nr:response regulator transcription factor [Acetobacteraceae bacterium]
MLTGTLARPPTQKVAAHVVHLVDDDEAVRRSLALLLASHGYASELYASAEAFLAATGRIKPGCMIVDIRMSGMDGLELQEELNRRGFKMPMIIVTGHGDVGLAVRAMKAGAIDFVEKPYTESDLVRAVNEALARFEDDQQQQQQVAAAEARVALLTARERDVLALLCGGRPNKVIAHELGISPRTVEIHRANVMEKLDARSLAEAVRVALSAGFAVA